MSEESGGPKQLTSVKCEIHGLRYNPNLHTGCVRCRKEAGETITGQTGQIPVMTGGAPPGSPGTGPAADDSLVPSLGAALVLVVLAGGGLFVAHQNAYDAFQDTFGEASFGEQYDPYGDYDEYDDYDAYDEVDAADEVVRPPTENLSIDEQQELEELQEELGKVLSDG